MIHQDVIVQFWNIFDEWRVLERSCASIISYRFIKGFLSFKYVHGTRNPPSHCFFRQIQKLESFFLIKLRQIYFEISSNITFQSFLCSYHYYELSLQLGSPKRFSTLNLIGWRHFDQPIRFVVSVASNPRNWESAVVCAFSGVLWPEIQRGLNNKISKQSRR